MRKTMKMDLSQAKTRFEDILTSDRMISIFSPLLATVIAFLFGGLMAMLTGTSPTVAYAALFKGSFGTINAFKQTIRYAIPIMVLAMSFAICDQSGFFYIGQKGAMYAAGMMICWIQVWMAGTPSWIMLIIMLIAGMAVSALLAMIPAFCKFKFGITESMIFVMADYIIIQLVEYFLLYTKIASPGSAAMPKSIPIVPSISPWGLYIGALLLLFMFSFLMKHDVLGYRIRMTGKNNLFAQSCGIPTFSTLVAAAAIGGALAGLTGMFEILGNYHTAYYNFAEGDLAFMGITAALLGREKPAGIVFGAIVLGAMSSGSISLSTKTNVSSELIIVITGFIMFFATLQLIREHNRRKAGGLLRNPVKGVR